MNWKYWIIVEHLPVTLTLATLAWMVEQNSNPVLAVIAFGWLIDIDHLFDYLIWITKTGRAFLFSDFMAGLQFAGSQKIYLPLHAWELAGVIFVIWCCQSEPDPVLLWSSIGITAHLIQDQLTHKPNSLGYFFFFRMFNAYEQARFCGK